MSDGINWGSQGINWGLFAPQSNPAANQGMSAFADQQRQAEQRRQFDMSHQLRLQENARQANQFDRSFGLQQQEFDQRRSQFDQTHSLAKSQDKRASDLHGFAVREKQDALDERGYERLKDANDLVQNAKTPEERQAVIDLGKSLGMNVDRYATSPNHFRLLQEGMRRRMAEEDQKRAQAQANTGNTNAQADERKADAELKREQANKLRTQQDDPIDQLIRERVNGMRGGAQPQAPMPQQPQGGVIPQSAPVEQGDPNLIPTQAAPQVQPRPQQQQMVDVPGIGSVPVDVAKAIQFKAARDKNQPLADLIGGAIGKLPKSMEDDVGKPLLAAINQRSRVENIMDQFKPDWLTIEGQATQMGYNFADGIGVLRDRLSPQQRERMGQYNGFMVAASQNLNDYIKEVTGAAMGIQEEKRIRLGVPDPQKDGPQRFMDKAKETLKIAGLAEARYRYMLKNGLQFDRNSVEAQFPLSRMQDIIQQRTMQLQKTLMDRGVPREQIAPMIQQQLKAEFQT